MHGSASDNIVISERILKSMLMIELWNKLIDFEGDEVKIFNETCSKIVKNNGKFGDSINCAMLKVNREFEEN